MDERSQRENSQLARTPAIMPEAMRSPEPWPVVGRQTEDRIQ